MGGPRTQVDGVLQFEGDAAAGSGEAVLTGWDAQIEAACKGVNNILEEIEKRYPGIAE